MDITYRPYIDPDLEVLIERIHPPRVCVDNDTYPDCTLVKVDSTNKHGKLLEMVQVLTDLDLVISKSYISSDGGWLMDVFHVTDQQGHKLTDEGLIDYIQEARPNVGNVGRPSRAGMPRHRRGGVDPQRPCACIIYVEDSTAAKTGRSWTRAGWRSQAQLENVVEAHHHEDERRSVRLAAPRRARPTRRGGSTSCWRPIETTRNAALVAYVVHHAAISSHGSIAFQEYYVRHKNGQTMYSEGERRLVTKCLIAATERRASHGLKLDICTTNRTGLLSDVTRVFREAGLSIKRLEIGIRDEKAMGTFYVQDTTGQNVTPVTLGDKTRNRRRHYG
ncbi:hypothetical protein DH2020_040913 [Rehmannia glutinosa]|uniref:ACT domain-containing protein ACR n=1 Tax=Rehmannia glutinosa TaxID=99300 RepID=A0ABR0URM8_REHGL